MIFFIFKNLYEFFQFFFYDFKTKFEDGILGEGQHFERPIFRNLKIANAKSFERSRYSIF